MPKTTLMLELEDKFQTPIEKLLPILVAKHKTDASAIRFMAATLGRPLDPSLIAVWGRRLGIADQIRTAKKQRR